MVQLFLCVKWKVPFFNTRVKFLVALPLLLGRCVDQAGLGQYCDQGLLQLPLFILCALLRDLQISRRFRLHFITEPHEPAIVAMLTTYVAGARQIQ